MASQETIIPASFHSYKQLKIQWHLFTDLEKILGSFVWMDFLRCKSFWLDFALSLSCGELILRASGSKR